LSQERQFGVCRLTSAGVAPCLRMFAPTGPPT